MFSMMPVVVTLHVTLRWGGPKGSVANGFYNDKILRVAIRRAAAIITPSESSKRDLIIKWPELESKINVIAHGLTGC